MSFRTGACQRVAEHVRYVVSGGGCDELNKHGAVQKLRGERNQRVLVGRIHSAFVLCERK